jgi:hypothetical protein
MIRALEVALPRESIATAVGTVKSRQWNRARDRLRQVCQGGEDRGR